MILKQICVEQGGLGMHGDIILKGTKTKGFKDSLRKTCQRRALLPPSWLLGLLFFLEQQLSFHCFKDTMLTFEINNFRQLWHMTQNVVELTLSIHVIFLFFVFSKQSEVAFNPS